MSTSLRSGGLTPPVMAYSYVFVPEVEIEETPAASELAFAGTPLS
jgi:hypothetical protein